MFQSNDYIPNANPLPNPKLYLLKKLIDTWIISHTNKISNSSQKK